VNKFFFALTLGLSFLPLMTHSVSATELDACVYGQHAPSTAFVEYGYIGEGGAKGGTSGSGFVISKDGYILTANHVLSPNVGDNIKVIHETVSVRLGSIVGEKIDGVIVTRDDQHDLALIKIPVKAGSPPLSPLPIGDSSTAGVGEVVTALGYPGGDVAVSPQSEITAANTYLHKELKAFWQTGLALNPGNSGGPVFGRLDTVIGVADAIRDDNAQAISFVVPIQLADSLLAQAGVKKSIAGSCADLPECAHPSHGIESYEVDEQLTGNSGWRDGGYNQTAYCNDYLTELKKQYPEGSLTRLSSSEEGRWTGIRHREYNYYCTFEHRERPVYRIAKGVECLPN
jgi:S1-C subfamily serine protease